MSSWKCLRSSKVLSNAARAAFSGESARQEPGRHGMWHRQAPTSLLLPFGAWASGTLANDISS